MRAALAIIAALAATPALAHDFWSNGEPVPPWVKAFCCGPEDVHHLKASAVHIMADGYHIDGIKNVIPIDKALPSRDGDFWAFFRERPGDDEPFIFCFFAPLNGA